MKASIVKKSKRVDLSNNLSLGVQVYGANNDYPQEIIEIVNASCTGKSCLSIYQKFCGGRGFESEVLTQMIVNSKGQTLDYILDLVAKDYAQFGGMAIHVNYNLNYTIREIQVVPFEHVRFEKVDSNNGTFDKLAIHDDWGRRNIALKKFNKESIIFLNPFNPDKDTIQSEVDECGGWQNYKGQLYYYSNQGQKTYPLPLFDSVVTDMSTEEGISNVSYRNARNNFFPAGMLIDRKNAKAAGDSTDESDVLDNIKSLQGDEQAGKILYVEIESEEEKPEFVPFNSANFDKQFEVTQKVAKDNIGRAFNQPPILRCEDVGGNFGADAMKNAYNFYNSHTESDRMIIYRYFKTLLKSWYIPTSEEPYILPLKYESEIVDLTKIPEPMLGVLTTNEKRILLGQPEIQTIIDDKTMLSEKLGVGGTQSLTAIIADGLLADNQKRELLKILFNLTEEQVLRILPL